MRKSKRARAGRAGIPATEIPVLRKASRRSLKGARLPFAYDSDHHYRVSIVRESDGWRISLIREPFAKPFRKRDGGRLVEPYKGEAEIYVASLGGEDAGIIQLEHQKWNNSMRVWDIAVYEGHRRKGVGAALMDKCRARAREVGARRIVLETQTSNGNAIAFYLSQGFDLVGMDASCYGNDDVEKNEVRLEMAYHLNGGGGPKGTRAAGPASGKSMAGNAGSGKGL